MSTYLTNLPEGLEKYGLAKTFLVRREVIHIKHVQTEVFIKKTIDVSHYLDKLELSIFDYMAYLTQRLRAIHHFPRTYKKPVPEVINSNRDQFFPLLDLHRGLKILIALDFDGTVTDMQFHELYKRMFQFGKVVIITANPTVTDEYFEKRGLPLPFRIHACKGKIKKIKTLINLVQSYDQTFYVDNETEYLDFAWLFGINTWHWDMRRIKYYTRKTS